MDCPACHHPNGDSARFCAKCGALLPAAPSAGDPLIGTLVGSRFRITGVLGEGGMGRVYMAEQSMGTSVRKVAVKTLLSQFAKDPQTVARFMREVGTVSELEHPNTIRVYDFGQTDSGELYIAMELLTGESLEAALEKGGPLLPERLDRIMGQVCGSLQEAHEKGIVHRDLKPANIQVSVRAGEDDYVKVLDFGIAKRSETKDSKVEAKLTQQGAILGTPPYMSPEQFTGKELDARSDIYSLGVVAYEALTGRLPFEADTPWQWATQHMTAQPYSFDAIPLAATVPPKMKAAIMRALSKDREQRQQTAREFFDELTLGTSRLSTLGGLHGSSASFPGAVPAVSATTGVMPARPGKTQLGEPLFVPPTHAPAGKTVIEAIPGSAMPKAEPSPHGAAPSPGGQSYAAPPVASAKKGGLGVFVGIGAVVLVAALVGAVLAFKPKPSAETTPIAFPSAGPVTVASEAPPESSAPVAAADTPDAGSPKVDPGTKSTGSSSTSTSTGSGSSSTSTSSGGASTVDPAAQAACEAAIGLAHGSNTTLAINRFRTCKGPKQAEARSAIDASATREVKAKGCFAKSVADAAASIGASSARAALPANCKQK